MISPSDVPFRLEQPKRARLKRIGHLLDIFVIGHRIGHGI